MLCAINAIEFLNRALNMERKESLQSAMIFGVVLYLSLSISLSAEHAYSVQKLSIA